MTAATTTKITALTGTVASQKIVSAPNAAVEVTELTLTPEAAKGLVSTANSLCAESLRATRDARHLPNK